MSPSSSPVKPSGGEDTPCHSGRHSEQEAFASFQSSAISNRCLRSWSLARQRSRRVTTPNETARGVQKNTETACQIDSPPPDLPMVKPVRSISGLGTHSIHTGGVLGGGVGSGNVVASCVVAKTAGPRPRSARSNRDPSGFGKGLVGCPLRTPWRPEFPLSTEVLTVVSSFTAPAPGLAAGSQVARRPPHQPVPSAPLMRFWAPSQGGVSISPKYRQ